MPRQFRKPRDTARSDRSLVLAGLSGILSPTFIATATILGDFLRDDYDAVRQSISELYEVGAPYAGWLMVLFTGYHALVIPLSFGLYRALPHSESRWIGPLLLGLAGLFGIPLGAYAQCDPGCFGATTFRGQLHGVLVVVTVALIFIAMYAIARQAKSEYPRYARYTFATLLIGVAFGAAMVPFLQGPYTGLLERLSVAIILQWYVVSGVGLIQLAQCRHGRAA